MSIPYMLKFNEQGKVLVIGDIMWFVLGRPKILLHQVERSCEKIEMRALDFH